jgi:hypothetical protein
MITPQNAPIGTFFRSKETKNIYKILKWFGTRSVEVMTIKVVDSANTSYREGQIGNLPAHPVFEVYECQDEDNQI